MSSNGVTRRCVTEFTSLFVARIIIAANHDPQPRHTVVSYGKNNLHLTVRERAGMMPWLIVISMTVAPVPVIMLILMFLMLVGEVSLVAFILVGPVGAVLAFVPIVIVAVPRVVDTDLDMFIVGCCSGGDYGTACRQSSR
jgi:hypothetical protein